MYNPQKNRFAQPENDAEEIMNVYLDQVTEYETCNTAIKDHQSDQHRKKYHWMLHKNKSGFIHRAASFGVGIVGGLLHHHYIVAPQLAQQNPMPHDQRVILGAYFSTMIGLGVTSVTMIASQTLVTAGQLIYYGLGGKPIKSNAWKKQEKKLGEIKNNMALVSDHLTESAETKPSLFENIIVDDARWYQEGAYDYLNRDKYHGLEEMIGANKTNALTEKIDELKAKKLNP